jgi:hypothetical protein
MTPPAPEIGWPPASNMSEKLTARRAVVGPEGFCGGHGDFLRVGGDRQGRYRHSGQAGAKERPARDWDGCVRHGYNIRPLHRTR